MAPGLMIAAATDGAKSTESLGAWTTMNTHIWRCLETCDALNMTQMGSVGTASWMRCGSVADFGSRGGRGKPLACTILHTVCTADTPTSRHHMPANEQCHGAMAFGKRLLGLSLAESEARCCKLQSLKCEIPCVRRGWCCC